MRCQSDVIWNVRLVGVYMLNRFVLLNGNSFCMVDRVDVARLDLLLVVCNMYGGLEYGSGEEVKYYIGPRLVVVSLSRVSFSLHGAYRL